MSDPDALKRVAFERCMCAGPVDVHLVPVTRLGVRIPDQFKKHAFVFLVVNQHNGARDLVVTSRGFSETLRFPTGQMAVFVPWSVVFLVAEHDTGVARYIDETAPWRPEGEVFRVDVQDVENVGILPALRVVNGGGEGSGDPLSRPRHLKLINGGRAQ